jgi:hypothetical protein
LSKILKNSNPLYKDTVNFEKTYLENTYIFRNYPAASFIAFEFSLIFLVYIILFVIFPESNENMAMAVLPGKNIIKLRKIMSSNIWNVLEFSINNKVFTKDLFKNKFNQFWDKVNNQFLSDNHMFVLFKIKYINYDYATIGKLQRININEKDWLFNWILETMEFKSEYYNETQIESFFFSYGFKKGKAPIKENFMKDLNFLDYRNNKLVISYNPLDYGILISEFKFENYTDFILQTNDNLLVNIKKFNKYNEVNLISGGKTILTFRDEWISDYKFVRIMDNNKYYFENNKEILFIKENKVKFISKLSKSKNLSNNFLVLDIETYIKDNILIPFAISIYDGRKTNSYILTDYKNSEDMIISALKSIMIRKYNNYKVYVHNLSKFDIIFLLKYLVKVGSINPIIHNKRIISVNLNFGKDNEYQLHFRDSYLLLLASLRKLGKSFNVENKKSIFPHFFVNENNLDYIGPVPDIKFFGKDVKLDEYNEYKANFINNNWSLKDEAIKYCELDCISLFQIILKFNNMIFNLFNLNIHKYPTLPSLAFSIYRSNFMMENIIPQLSGKIANDIRQSYTGGAVDMYIPQPPNGVKMFCYDVNALYPSQMSNMLMPVGNPSYFKGNIRILDLEAFGFFYCKIIAPDNLKHPILQTHVKTNNGIRTIAPLGQWEDMIFSEEMDNAKKLGYQFEILWGYTFDSRYIFEEYVNTLHNMRKEYPPGDPMNYIAKILLNSLYGRFGMDDNFIEVNIIHKDFYADFENKFIDNILESKELGDYKLVSYKNENKEIQDEATHNISIGIAASITAYARIYMSWFKNNPNFNLYYSDTDSAYIDKQLPKEMVDSKMLGKLKLENICNKAIFLSPKVYCLETENGKIIYKVKGLSHDIELNMKDFEHLLYKDSILEKYQTKWMRNLSDAQIKLMEQVYTLKVTDNKRELIYENNKLISTKPYIIDNNKGISN